MRKIPALSWKRYMSIIAIALAAAILLLAASRVRIEWSAFPGASAVPGEGAEPLQEKSTELPDPGRFEQVAETDALRLKLDRGTGHFIVEDKRNGNVYHSFPDPQYWAEEKVSDTWKQHLASPFMLQYADFSEPIINPKELSYSPLTDRIVGLELIPGGYRLTYVMPSAGFSVPIEVTIKDDYVETTIRREGVEEDRLSLIWIRLFPFFGGTYTDGKDGYLFVPDGPGALISFKNNTLNVNKIYDESVYGADMVYRGLSNNRNSVNMPVFGMKSGDKGFLAVLHEGEEYAHIIASPAGVFSNYNWIAAQMKYRSSFLQFARRNDPVEYGFVDFNRDELFGGDRKLRYYLLDKGETDYVGMAQRYRQYLMEEQGIAKLEPGDGTLPLHLTVIGGDQEKGTFSSRYIKGTTTAEAESMVRTLHESGIGKMSVTYTGWQEGGYSQFGRGLPVESKLGGNDGMKRFIEYAHSIGVPVYLDTEYALNNTGAGGFDKEFAGVTNLAGQTIDVRMPYNPDSVPAVSDKFVLQAVQADLDEYRSLGADGLVVNRTGRDLFSDYNTKYGSTRIEARDVQEEIMKSIKDGLGGVQGVGSNFYALPYVDHIHDMVSDYSYDLFSDEAVPFAQIAVHGLVTYSFDYANNRDEHTNGFLREIEYGAVPSFIFTQAETKNFLNAYGIRYYSTRFEDWATYAADEYKRFNEALGDVQYLFITGHRTLAPNVKETTYENGKRIVVNYNTEPYREGGLEVPAQSFIVLEGGAAGR
ncbi:DUF5696 domain-containing protein [Paenibacillus cisolokensis]|uniref:DUF5696 domain-containing protein n=1 Tax=Paenibacillus cisolokensis TaxID=1658519 RepID=UPI003D27FD43